MDTELSVLLITAASVGFLHTVLGPDHYLPFIAMARALKWSTVKTVWITIACGIGHVSSSVLIGLLGVSLGWAITIFEAIDSVRGEIASWFLISFGLFFLLWGLKRLYKHKPHVHSHIHENGNVHAHQHTHIDSHTHIHQKETTVKLTPWILFTIFVFGPCETLVPILIYPASQKSLMGIVLITLVFALFTIGTMLAIVLASLYGIKFIPIRKNFEKYSFAVAGAVILFSGLAVKFLGL